MAAVDRDEIEMVAVHSFSRFARSTTHLLNALTRFKQKGVHFVSISERIDTNSAIGVAIFSILAAMAQLERDWDQFSLTSLEKTRRRDNRKQGRELP
jgi:DNA invertase Pin-like site-specific DNA recombinase